MDFSSYPPQPGDEVEYDYARWGNAAEKSRQRFMTTVYNVEVEDWHTYFVGATGLWVHNKNCFEAKTETRRQQDFGHLEPLKDVLRSRARSR